MARANVQPHSLSALLRLTAFPELNLRSDVLPVVLTDLQSSSSSAEFPSEVTNCSTSEVRIQIGREFWSDEVCNDDDGDDDAGKDDFFVTKGEVAAFTSGSGVMLGIEDTVICLLRA